MKTETPVKWLFQRDIFDEGIEHIVKATRNLGMSAEYVMHAPFGGDFKVPKEYDFEDCIVFYGSLNMMKRIQKEQPWIPGGFCNFDGFECTSYYKNFHKYLFNSDYLILPVCEIIRCKELMCSLFGIDESVFVRPNHGWKSFAGQVLRYTELVPGNLGYRYSYSGFPTEDEKMNELALISTPKTFDAEYRLFVTKKEVISGCRSHVGTNLDPDPHVPRECLDFALTVLYNVDKSKFPDPIFVMDVVEKNGNFYIIELNSASCSGIYACDPVPIIKKMSELALAEWMEYQHVSL